MLEGLVKRAPMPVELRFDLPNRLDTGIEAAAYFLVSEALTNAAKHAQADAVTVEVAGNGETVVVSVADDGVGGRLEITSPKGEGTRICARLPIQVLGSLNGFSEAAS
ncbi:MAG TPA: ATP-binding protein [Thermoleophilaceae bacterium]